MSDSFKSFVNANQKNIFFVVLGLIAVAVIWALSGNSNEDKVTEVARNGSIETSIKVEHLNDNFDVLISTNKIWCRNSLVKTTVHIDTIPSLGTTFEEAENEDGGIINVIVKKDYEVYITVK